MSDLGDITKLKVPELKNLLKERGLPISGTKQVLVERLGIWLAENADCESSINDSTINDGTDQPEEMEAEEEAEEEGGSGESSPSVEEKEEEEEEEKEEDPNSSMQVEPPSMISDSILEESATEQQEDKTAAEVVVVPEVASTCGDGDESPRKRKRVSQGESSDEAAKVVSPQPKKGKTEGGAVAEEAAKAEDGVEKMEEEKKEEEKKEEDKKEEEKKVADDEAKKREEERRAKLAENTPQKNFFRERDLIPDDKPDEVDPSDVILDKYLCDVNLVIDDDGLGAKPVSAEAMAYLYAGSRATWGVTSGKVCFEVKVTEIVNCPQAQSAGRTSEVNLNDIRIGFSAGTANNQLGEDKHSYAITMAGKKCTQKYFDSFRPTETAVNKDDVVTACLDLDASPRTISFLVNGENMTTAFEIPEVDPEPEPEEEEEEEEEKKEEEKKGEEKKEEEKKEEKKGEEKKVEEKKEEEKKEEEEKEEEKKEEEKKEEDKVEEEKKEEKEEKKEEEKKEEEKKEEEKKEEEKKEEEKKEEEKKEEEKKEEEKKEEAEGEKPAEVTENGEKMETEEEKKDEDAAKEGEDGAEKAEKEEKGEKSEEAGVEKADGDEKAEEGKEEEKKDDTVAPLMEEGKSNESTPTPDYTKSKFDKRVKPLMKPPRKFAFPEGIAVFPHILLKNVKVEVNFGQTASAHPAPEGYQFIHNLPLEARVRSPLPPKEKSECTVMYLVGLPFSGKSTWVASHLSSEEGKAKNYSVLSAPEMFKRMTSLGVERNPRDFTFVRDRRFSNGVKESFQDKANKCLSKFLDLASRKRRNYIIEEKSNTYDMNQRRKMAPFYGFQRKAVVVITEEEEFKTRLTELEKAGSNVPKGIMNEIKMNFTIPKIEENKEVSAFDDVVFVGVEDKDKAEEIVNKFKEEAKNAPQEQSRGFGRGNFRGGNDRGRGRFEDRRGNFNRNSGNFQRGNFHQGNFNNRGNFGNQNGRGGFNQNRNQQQRGGFKPGFNQGQQSYQNFGNVQQFQQNWSNFAQQQFQTGYGSTGYGQQPAQGYGQYQVQGAQAGWTPQQQLWAQQWQQYYQQQAASQRK